MMASDGGAAARYAAVPVSGTLPAVDDSTSRYVASAQPVFDLFRQAESQFAGLLVLAAAGSRLASPDHPLMVTARAALRDATELLRDLRPTPRSQHHHYHLGQAARLFHRAFDRAEIALRAKTDAKFDIDPAYRPLENGHRHLFWAARALPGFEMIDLEQGCCAAHRGLRYPPRMPAGAGAR